MEGKKMSRKGWVVTFSGMGLNLALGTLYAWSVFGKQLTEAIDKGGFGWSKTAAAMPYSIAIGFFALMMIPAGRLQDKLGPGIIATIGAILMALGMIVTSFSSPGSPLPAIIGICYGACLSLFPSACADYWGTKNLGLNYGILFTAYGIGGVFGPILAGRIADSTGNYSMAYTVSAALMILAAVLTFFTKAPGKKTVPVAVQAEVAPKLQAAD